jgi:predicted RNA-binding protein with EMAP domain
MDAITRTIQRKRGERKMIEIIKEIHKEIEDLYRVYFNLLEVLTKKGVLDFKDIEYIRHNGEKKDETR